MSPRLSDFQYLQPQVSEESATSFGWTHETEFKKLEECHFRIIHTKRYEPTLIFIGDLCGPGEMGMQSGFTS